MNGEYSSLMNVGQFFIEERKRSNRWHAILFVFVALSIALFLTIAASRPVVRVINIEQVPESEYSAPRVPVQGRIVIDRDGRVHIEGEFSPSQLEIVHNVQSVLESAIQGGEQ